MSCQLCTEGWTHDLVFGGGYWTVEETGRCKHCNRGQAEPRAEIVQLARRSGWRVSKILGDTLVKDLEFWLKFGRRISEAGLNRVLAEYLPAGDPDTAATPLKTETGTRELIKAGVPMKDGFVPEEDQIPF